MMSLRQIQRPASDLAAHKPNRRAPPPVRAAIWTEWLEKLGVGRPSKAAPVSRAVIASKELLEVLRDPAQADAARATELFEVLVEEGLAGLPFDEQSIGGGEWVVRYTKGKPLLWNVAWGAGKVVNSGSRASQSFNPEYRSAVNKVELNGPDSFISAEGFYEPVDDSATTPKAISVRIGSGRLRAWGADVPLPIGGTGTFEVVYVDERLRVFRSNGSSWVVQVRAELLDS